MHEGQDGTVADIDMKKNAFGMLEAHKKQSTEAMCKDVSIPKDK